MTEKKPGIEAWVLYDTRLGLQLPVGYEKPIFFDNESDALDSVFDSNEKVQAVVILTNTELSAMKEQHAKELEEAFEAARQKVEASGYDSHGDKIWYETEEIKYPTYEDYKHRELFDACVEIVKDKILENWENDYKKNGGGE